MSKEQQPYTEEDVRRMTRRSATRMLTNLCRSIRKYDILTQSEIEAIVRARKEEE